LEDGGEVNLQACRCPWVRVLLPLKVEERLVGIWLLGSRDPDDAYEAGEVGVLQAIANQTAIALVNIQQSKRLHALYQADIEREDAERAELALFLHDEVLNPLAALSMRMEAAALSPEVEQAYQELVGNIRQALGGLRPAMLNFGLYPALEELVDELAERSNGGVSTKLDLQPTLVRYEAKAEQHLYRIVEQACVNALQHARPRQLSVSGALQPDEVRLEVRDDGMGMPVGMALNMSQLLLEGHYGLVGMFERAALIGADLKISSSPESGTCIELSWKPDTPRTN
jgi:signal transduction histidine kinase